VTSLPRRLGGPGYDVVETALATIDRYGMLEPGDRVLVAVSGGPDSTCLLDVLWRLADRLELDIQVVHVDHGLQEGSDEVAGKVATAAAEAGFEVHVVRAPDLSGPNLHARAREFRYGFFDLVAGQAGASRIATGHTLDDRIETTLARLVHGSGTAGLAGIPPVEGRRIRPLIEVRRPQTRAYCDDTGLTYFDDPANDDERFERSIVRRDLVSAIERRWGDGAIRAMARSAEQLRVDGQALKELADRLYADLVRAAGGAVEFDRAAFAAVPRALQRRLLESATGRIRDRSGGIEAALDAVADERVGTVFDVAGGVRIEVQKSNLRVTRPGDGRPTEVGSADES
jgi:tRNA(Ile)-lysidine synthase